ncbi:hypothetical protein ABIB40_003599 [Pedobacter sp. UYP30]|uniref:DUF5672 family protein n=1 Tax=Pedobacter sp. UYP30 TaxID=1756400 RepID=UPI0033972D7C
MSNMVVVVIPIYKVTPSDIEVLSLKQCLTVLDKHKIIFIGPKELNFSKYQEICEQHHIDFDIKLFDDIYFSGISGYNSLMLSTDFYKGFLSYKFLLIYQLDAYVFKDELLYWCNQNFDFIGAPHQPHKNNAGEIQFLKSYSSLICLTNRFLKTQRKISNVGNGGFSLRKTKSCYRLLKTLKKSVVKWGANNEDGFFKYWGNLLHPLFRLPSDQIALRFSIEESPSALLLEMKGKLPFGCHAFEKHEPETWQKHINFKIKN